MTGEVDDLAAASSAAAALSPPSLSRVMQCGALEARAAPIRRAGLSFERRPLESAPAASKPAGLSRDSVRDSTVKRRHCAPAMGALARVAILFTCLPQIRRFSGNLDGTTLRNNTRNLGQPLTGRLLTWLACER